MKVQKILLAAVLAASVATLTAAPQSDKQPIVSSTGRFGDPTGVAIKYRDYLYGIVKEVDANQVVLSKTKFGVDQPFKFTKKTKFLLDGKPSTFDKIKVGEGVFIDVDTDKKTGDQLAKKVVCGVDLPTLQTDK
jgi:hypothetical protein